MRLKPQDPFDLIRLLARSQSDPRKAVAELVQNSLDAGARAIEVTWFNEKGRRALRVWDDGGGIFPELGRAEALERIARTIGHSHKKNLTPAERREQMVLGRYGIGLLGFWSVGEVMEIRSRVGGGEVGVLRLREDERSAEVHRSHARRVEEEETFTEITIRRVHDAAARLVRPPRLQAYLADELRGQLLDRGAEIRVRDRVARGRARKLFLVQPEPFLGAPLDDLRALHVEGYEDARLELYLVPAEEERAGRVALACGGTTVLEDLADVDGSGLPRPPWSSGRVEGVVDFPELDVAPSTRRGYVPNAASSAFLAALERLEATIEERLASEERRREEQRQKNLARDIRRAFRSVVHRLPEVDLFDVRAGAGPRPERPSATAEGAALGDASAGGAAEGEGGAPPEGEPAPPEPPLPPDLAEEAEPGGDAQLFPPGPLASLALAPSKLRVPPGARRTVRARPLDADGRRAGGDEVRFAWHLEGPGELEPLPERDRVLYTAPAEAPIPLATEIVAVALQGDRRAEATCHVDVLPELAGRERTDGIPEPIGVHAPAEPWRSRVAGTRWEFNTGHPDYRSVEATESRRLRYLIHLFAKEVVLRNFGRPGDGEVLERMVQVVTHLGANGRV